MTAREVILEGGSPWGFRMHGGADVGQPLRISRVNPGSKASQRGVREGDIITSINGQATRGLANTDAHSLLRGAGHALHLGLNQDASPKRRSHNKHQQQSTNITQQITPEVDTSTSQPCSTATTTIVVGCSGNSDPGAVPPMSKCTAATPASSQLTNQQQQQQQQPKAGTSSPQRTPPNTATNTPIQESTKSHKSSSGGGRQKRSRRLKARKKALKEAICEPKDTIINEPLWEELCEINPIPNAVHASPLLSAEALCLSDDVEPRPDIPTVEELKQLLSIHLRIDDIPKKKTKLKRRAETFPPSLRRLEVIAEEDDNIYEDVLIPQTINQDESENIYEDVELQHSNTNSVFRAEQCYIYSDSDEEEKERKIESEYVLLPCRVIQIVSDDDLSDNSINKQLQDAAVEIIEVNDNNKVCDISEELYVGSPVNIIENNEESVQYEYITSSVNVCETYSASTTINNNNNNKEIIEISGNLNSNNDENIRADSDDNNSICLTDNSSLNVKLNEDSLIQTLTAMNSSQYEENYETLIEQSSLGIQNESFYDEMIETLEVQEETNREVRPIYHTEENLNQLQMKLSQKKTQENEIKETDNGNSSNIYQPESQPELEINSNRSLQSQENEIICSNVSNIVNKFEINNTNICNKNKEIDNSECNIDINDTKNNSNEKYTSVNCENLILTDVPHETNKQFLNTDETVYKVVENSNVFIYTSIITTESHSSCTQNNFVVLSQEELQNQTHIDTKDDEIIISEFNSDEELEQQINLEFEELYNTNYPEEISSENNICTQEFTENIIISDYNVDDKFNLQEEICINSDTLSHERSSVHIEEIENETIEERRPNFEVIPSIEITKCEYENDDIESEIVDTETIKCKNDESISENEAIDLQNIENVLDIRESKEINNKYKEAENISDTVENEIEINRKIIVEEDFTKIDENKTIVCEKYINGEIIPEIVKNEQINKEYIDCENVNKTMENEEINAQFTKQEDYTENIQNKEINAQFTKQEVYTENIQNEEINTQFTQQEDYTENIQNEEINAQFTKQEDYTENIQNEEINTQFTQQEDYTENIQNEEINAQFTQQEDYNENIQNEEINAQFTQQEDYTENIQNEEINAQFTKQEVYSENIGNDFENEEICPEVAENEENEYEIIDTEENTTDEYQYEIEESNREIVHNELSTNEDETDEGENKENNYPETEIFKKEIIQYDQESVIKIERENDIISSESIINEYNNITENVLQSMSFVTNKLAHILQVTDQAASILNQKLPETNTIVTAEVPAICNENTLYTSLNEDDSNLQDYNLEEREFSLSEKTDSTYQLRQFLKSIREDMNNGIEITPTHSRSESIDSNCSLNTTVYCDVKSNNSSSSLSLYFNNSCISGTQPKSLRKLCLDVVAQFPNGLKLMLDWGLATVEELDLRIQPKLNLEFTPPASTSSCSTTHRSSLPATSHAEGCCSKHGYHGGYDCSCWLSVPAYGPYFVCLSPAQQKILPQNVSPEKAAALLDLHYKVSQRRAYHEPGSHQAGSQLKMGLNEDQQEQHLKASILSDWLAQARFEQQQPQLRAKSPLTRFEKLNEESNMTSVMKTARKFEAERYHISKQRDIAVEIQEQKHYTVQKEQIEQEQSYENDFESELNKPCNPPVTENEIFREQMFSEYQQQMAERAERRQNKILRVSEMGSSGQSRVVVVPGAPESAQLEVLEEFANRARKRMEKLGISEEENEMTASILSQNNNTSEMTELQQQEIRDIFVLEGGATQLPKRIQEDSQLLFSTADKDGAIRGAKSMEHSAEACDLLTEIQQELSRRGQARRNSSIPVLAPTFKATAPKPGVWSPKPGRAASASAAPVPSPAPVLVPTSSIQNGGDEPPPPPVWTPKASPTLERKEFRPVRFDATTPPLKLTPEQESVAPPFDINSIEPEPPLRDKASSTISSSLDRKLTLNIPRLPRAQNPTVTLLQKAREGQLPRGALYLDHKMSSKESEAGGSKSTVRSEDIMYTVKKETVSDGKKTVELSPKKYDGIGPTTKDGIPIVLRSGIKEENYGKWYKRMYDSLHKAGRDDDHITIRYRPNRRGYPYSAAGGYASEPEPVGGYDSDIGYSAKYATLDRRRIKNKDSDFTTSTMPRSRYISPSVKYACEVYKNQPGRIEDYEPGHSSISDKEAKLWWDEVMDIFDGDLAELEMLTKRSEAQTSSGKPFMTYALKESGYESDSQLVFKRRDESSSGLSPTEHKQAYKVIQSGGEVPLHGLRKPAPERPKDPLVLPSYYQDFDSGKESPHKFVDCGEVTIHYRSPVRGLARDAALSEEELARRQEEAMRRIYQEERRRKYLQELHDMESRRHTDNFTPSQKSPIPLNRYDDFFDDVPSSRGRDRTPEPKMVARALYNFVGQSPRELTFRRGDIIIVRRQIDKNWYEGEHNASIGLFPFNYVEIIPYDGVRSFPKGPLEGKARAKFNFVAQTHLELSLVKGENVVLTRRVDDNWYEGRIGARKGIFPVSYVEVIQEPGERLAPISPKPVASPASHSLLLNGSASSHQTGPSQRPHQYNPYSPPSHYNLTGRSILAAPGTKQLAPVNQTLHIDTHSEPVPYRALYNYKPQNDDELELREGDTVFVMEKCDDGWYVGSSHRSGHFGTFPGNYVERV